MEYVVYITLYKGTKLPPWYIGSTSKEKIESGYNGSVASKEYKKVYIREQKDNKHLFKTRVLSYHKSREDAYIEEKRLQKMHSVVENDRYYNKSYANDLACLGGDTSKFIDYESEARKKNHAEAMKKSYDRRLGKLREYKVCCDKCTSEFSVTEREKQFPKKEKYFCTRSCANSKVQTKEANEKRRLANKAYNLKHGIKPINNSKGTKYMHFGSKNIRVKKSLIPYYLDQGWEYGMIRINKYL